MCKTRHPMVWYHGSYLSCMPTLQYNDMGRGPRVKAYAAKQLSVGVVCFPEAPEEQKRALCAFWIVHY